MNIRSNHQQAIALLAERFKDDPRFPAAIVGGSVAKGRAKRNSDLDLYIVASEEEYVRRLRQRDYHFSPPDICRYAGGYVDGKVVDLSFLKEAADHGSEPARASFTGAIVAYSRISGLPALIRRIVAYPEKDRRKKIAAFHAQLICWNGYVAEAQKRKDQYLLRRSVAELVFYGGRMILAHNRILYPYHKWLMHEVQRAPRRPANLIRLTAKVLARPSVKNAQRYTDCILGYRKWEEPPEGWISRFLEDVEWGWRTGAQSCAEW
ncbi:MAG: nucleotidyltransferase domain-containing protein [Opitutaceae bacterium]|nr:nucleotidyltransferase domain-containing protein [Opitutaceae bacterium]